jgi:mono/diheme cytochrome c family protein
VSARIAAVAATIALAGVPLACGTTDEDGSTVDSTTETSQTTPQPADSDQPVSPGDEAGRELFVSNCGSCHTLDAAGTEGQIGPNLDEAQVDEAEVLEKIAEGPGAMPSNLVSGKDAAAVAAFVANNGPAPPGN